MARVPKFCGWFWCFSKYKVMWSFHRTGCISNLITGEEYNAYSIIEWGLQNKKKHWHYPMYRKAYERNCEEASNSGAGLILFAYLTASRASFDDTDGQWGVCNRRPATSLQCRLRGHVKNCHRKSNLLRTRMIWSKTWRRRWWQTGALSFQWISLLFYLSSVLYSRRQMPWRTRLTFW